MELELPESPPEEREPEEAQDSNDGEEEEEEEEEEQEEEEEEEGGKEKRQSKGIDEVISGEELTEITQKDYFVSGLRTHELKERLGVNNLASLPHATNTFHPPKNRFSEM